MNGSRLTHGILTEPVCKNMSGKGREGNKEGKGTRVETSHHFVASVTHEADNGMMTDLDIIEALDFTPELPCEHPSHNTHGWHAGPAKFLISRAGHCGPLPNMLICEAGFLGSDFLRCNDCGFAPIPRDETWRIVEVLR